MPRRAAGHATGEKAGSLGREQPAETGAKQAAAISAVHAGGAVADADLAAIVAAWPLLPAEVRADVIAIIRRQRA